MDSQLIINGDNGWNYTFRKQHNRPIKSITSTDALVFERIIKPINHNNANTGVI